MTTKIIYRANGFPDFIVDRSRSVLLNTNTRKIETYKKERALLSKLHAKVKRIDRLENELSEIKNLLIKSGINT